MLPRLFGRCRPRDRMLTMVMPVLAVLGTGCALPTDDRSDAVLTATLDAASRAERAGDFATVAARLEAVYRVQPSVEVARRLSRALRRAGRPVAARSVVTEGIDRFGDSAELLLELGRVELADGRPTEAEAALQRALALESDLWQVHAVLGITFDRSGRYTEAARHYEQALALSPDNPLVLNNYGLSRALAGDLQGGLALLNRAVRAGAGAQVEHNLALLDTLRAGSVPSRGQTIQHPAVSADQPGLSAKDGASIAVRGNGEETEMMPAARSAVPSAGDSEIAPPMTDPASAKPVTGDDFEPERRYYVVRHGGRLADVARVTGLDAEVLAILNPHLTAQALQPGTRVRLPPAL